MTGIVPLITFGSPVEQKGFDSTSVEIGTIPPSGAFTWSDGSGFPSCAGAGWVLDDAGIVSAQPFRVNHYIPNDSRVALDPSYIGVDCTGDYPALSVHIAMPSDNTATIEGGQWAEFINYENDASAIPNYGGSGNCPGAPEYWVSDSFGLQMRTVDNPPAGFTSSWTVTQTRGPATLLTIRPEFFRLLPSQRVADNGNQSFNNDAADQSYGGQEVTPDHWHHLLLSFDLTKDCSTKGGSLVTNTDGSNQVISDNTTTPGTTGQRTSSTIRMWVAFDDHNLTAKSLSVYWPEGYHDLNAVLSVTGYFIANDNSYTSTGTMADQRGVTVSENNLAPDPFYYFNPQPIQLTPLGLPSTSTYVNAIKRVEMAELQVFTGVTLDTAITKNRRVFVSKDGTPVDPTKGTEEDDPTPPAEKLLGKKPDILLHGSGNWKDGKNTGSIGIALDGKIKPAGQFKPTGGIEQYTPDPVLEDSTI